MKVHDQIAVLSKLSKLAGKPYLLVSVDQDLIDQNGTSFERHFDMLSGEVLDEIRHCGSAIFEVDDIMEAQNLYLRMEVASENCRDVGLYAMVFFDGHTMLGISQNKGIPVPAAQQVVSLLIM
jgi:hypothetical protein